MSAGGNLATLPKFVSLEHVDVIRLQADEALFDTRDDIGAREDVLVPLASWGRGRADHTTALARGTPVRNVAPDALLAETVVDRGVDVVDAGVESGVENGFCLGLGDLTAARGSAAPSRRTPTS